MYQLLTAESARVQICAHRGHCMDRPENTMAAFRRAVEVGATSLEIDVVLSQDDEIVVLHDLTLDRTTSGRGFAGDHPVAGIRELDAGTAFDPAFAGEKVPLLEELLEFAAAHRVGLHCEIKERFRPDALVSRLAELVRGTAALDWLLAISFDHVQLQRARAAIPGLRSEGITHARHVDMAGLARRAGPPLRLHRDGDVLTRRMRRRCMRAGVAIRCHIPRPAVLAGLAAHGLDLRPVVGGWVAAGLVDILSGDDVAWLRALVDEYAPG